MLPGRSTEQEAANGHSPVFLPVRSAPDTGPLLPPTNLTRDQRRPSGQPGPGKMGFWIMSMAGVADAPRVMPAIFHMAELTHRKV